MDIIYTSILQCMSQVDFIFSARKITEVTQNENIFPKIILFCQANFEQNKFSFLEKLKYYELKLKPNCNIHFRIGGVLGRKCLINLHNMRKEN